jgi:hypothetical protein
MKQFNALLTAAALVALAIGCHTTSKKEDMLTKAGFRAVRADTGGKYVHLQALTPHKITTVQRNGMLFYVYPDADRSTLYVGQQAQYQRYQALRSQNQLPDEPLEAAPPNENTWSLWGPWWGWGWQW